MNTDPAVQLENYRRVLRGYLLDYANSPIAPAVEHLIHGLDWIAIDEAGIQEANRLLDELAKSLLLASGGK